MTSQEGYRPPPRSEFPAPGPELERIFRFPGTDTKGRAICDAKGHLICRGDHCGGSCACANEEPGDFAIRVVTDKDGDTMCAECRYESKTAEWNH